MLELILKKSSDTPLTLLFLGAHSDDIEIGCGGTILRLAEEYPHLSVHWVVFGASGSRSAEAEESAKSFLYKVEDPHIYLRSFRDGFFPYIGGEIKDYFEELKSTIKPDLIFTHYRKDLHQDHRLICELTWNTYRDHLILEYEIPKYDGDLGAPNFYVRLNETISMRKVDILCESFATQREKYWFTADTFLSLMRLRGVEARSPGKYAEAFYANKVIV